MVKNDPILVLSTFSFFNVLNYKIINIVVLIIYMIFWRLLPARANAGTSLGRVFKCYAARWRETGRLATGWRKSTSATATTLTPAAMSTPTAF